MGLGFRTYLRYHYFLLSALLGRGLSATGASFSDASRRTFDRLAGGRPHPTPNEFERARAQCV